MKAKIKLFKTDGVDKNGCYPIKLILTHNYKEKRVTIAKSKEKDWNFKSQLPIDTHPDFDNLYLTLHKKRIAITKIEFSKIISFEKAIRFINQSDRNFDLNFYEYAQKQIDFMNKVGRHGNADSYVTAINQLKKFRDSLMFSEIDSAFVSNFKKHLKEKPIYGRSKEQKNTVVNYGISNSAIRSYINGIKAIYNYGIREHSQLEDSRPFEKFTIDLPVSKRRVKNVYLDKERLKILEDNQFDVPYLDRARKLILLQFYLGGNDFMDIYYLLKKDLHKGRVYFKSDPS